MEGRNCEKESNNLVNLRGPTTTRSTAVDGSHVVKESRSGGEAQILSYHCHLIDPEFMKTFFGQLYINSTIIILNNPQQEGDGGCT